MINLPTRKRIKDQQSTQAQSDRSMMFKAFCSEHHQRLFAWALRCTQGQEQEAEDVMTELYTLFLSGKANQLVADEWLLWSFGSIRRLAHAQSRKHKWRQRLLHTWFTSQSEPVVTQELSEKYEEDQVKATRISMVNQALRHLSTRQQEIIVLVMYEDLSLTQIAQVLNLGVGSVRTHYHRAKQKLSAYFRDYLAKHPEAQDLVPNLAQVTSTDLGSTPSPKLSLERAKS